MIYDVMLINRYYLKWHNKISIKERFQELDKTSK